ncbi:SMP-30/gluconolactonase/LRE family protein [Cellulomonas sp. P24]|uniref:SMP-30/gluconolactonase/LRE family protein n=1 Tax=Cellulomonas sp. P24 TaxID=2885206 RepID=UPI00216AF93A|nr:SMP-30/gluconolactonase/LRE family protein [Cellulomonas sp. P24]MCR6493690.1 SMP-30/gluconolactonase/LRE family protein [Cellulomonas sp. P24]
MAFDAEPPGRWTDPPVRYPDPAVKVLDPRFSRYRIVSAAVERLATGFRWVEGPVWFGDQHALVWSDVPGNTMWRWDELSGQVTPFRSPSHFSNGNTRDRQGRLVTCEHLERRVTRTEYDGSVSVLADRFQDRRLNSPNDVITATDGAIWFSDPTYGIVYDYEGNRAEPELPTAVYRLAPDTGTLTAVVTGLVQPNGLCFSPDEQLLYVVDSGTSPGLIHVFDVDGPTVRNGRVFADMGPGSSDGVRCDVDGNLWASAAGGGDGYDGVHVFAPDGTLIGQVLLPEQCANMTFGGRKGNRLFMAASQSIYSLYVNTSGCV